MKLPIRWISQIGLSDLSLLSTVTIFALSIGVSFLSQALLGTSLGLEGFGHFSSSYAKAAVLSGMLTWGLDISALKFASSYIQLGNTNQFRRFTVFSLSLTLFSSLVFIFSWYAIRVEGLNFAEEFTPVLSFAIICWTMTRLLAALLRAMGHQALSLFVDRIVRDGILVVACLWALSGFGHRLTIFDSFDALALGCGLGFVISLAAFMWARKPKSCGDDEPSIKRQEWVGTSLSLWAANLFELAFSRAEVILLAYFGQASNAGLFAILLAISNLLLLPTLALNVFYQPRFAALNGPGNKQKLREEARRFVLTGLPATLLIGFAILASPRFFLALFGVHNLGNETTWCLMALVVLRMALGPIGARASILQMNEGHFKLAKIIFFGLALKVAMLIGPINSGSIVGVTFASITTTLIAQLLIYYSSQKLMAQLKD